MADLSKFSLSETSFLVIRRPDGSLDDARIEVFNKYTKTYQKSVHESFKGSVDFLVKEKRAELSDEEVLENRNKILALCTKSWENIEWEGKPLECNYENALMLYNHPGLAWLRDQVHDFVHNSGNFLGNSQAG